MRIKYIDNHSSYTAKSYIAEQNMFELTADDGSTLYYYPKLQLDKEYDPRKYSIHLLTNSSPTCSENSIFQVYVGKQRIGWVFPLQALFSNEHDYADNPYFLKYAYVASELLLQSIEETDEQVEPEEFYLDDYYNSDYNLLVLDSDNTANIEGFDLDDYLVGFFKYGYSFGEGGNALADLNSGDRTTRINVKPISRELSKIRTINDLFREQLPFTKNEVMQFHLCYQIIELLIEIIFEDKFSALIDSIAANPKKLFDHKDSLSTITGEKYRVKELFTSYVNLSETGDKTDLNTACARLLAASGKDVSTAFYYNLYAVRCLIVHQLYSLTKDMREMLAEINKPFLNIVMDALFTFQKPSIP